MKAGAGQVVKTLLATGAMRIVAGEKVAMAAGISTTTIVVDAKAVDIAASAACLQGTCRRLDNAESGMTADLQVISRRPVTAADCPATCRTTHV
jgi:hypothetical protein